MHKIARLFVFGCLFVDLGHVSSANGETVGERFDKAIKEIAKQCASRKLEPNEVCGEVAELKPADPLATEEGRFAHSIKIPNPVPKDSGYKPGMTSQEYFDHLCKTEAGEFIYKTVENVEGLYLMRSREQVNDYKLQHLYALEDPYAYSDIENDAPQKLFINPPWWRYKFFETRKAKLASSDRAETHYLRYFGYVQDKSPMNIEETSTLKSHYGYTWRGIERSHDRELGIVGGELIVMDLHSNEVLAVRRGFIRSGDVRNLTGVWWLGGHVCPRYKHANAYTYEFLSKVLKPTSEVSDGGSDATK
ncbi:MAG: hypothetical protein EHM80_09955 [Nitrospiraceae bacterium]|nr:MAG: hypothetical protein EHM80_09955 [Nitrospiraceae bacterium]